MTNRQDGKVSIPRRRVLMAGGAGMVAPFATFGAGGGLEAGGTVVLSGCIRNADARPMAGLAFEIHAAGIAAGQAVTDGDGRFVLRMRLPAHPGQLALHASGVPPQSIRFEYGAAPGGNGVAQVERDSTDVWRAAVGLTLA